MFGKKKQLMADEIKNLKQHVDLAKEHYKAVVHSKEKLDANLEEIRDSRKQVEKSIGHVSENVESEINYIQDNINAEASLIYSLEHLVMDMNGQNTELDAIKAELAENYKELMSMVDSSKHFTSLSKSLQDFVDELGEQNESYTNYLNYMSDYSKQMGVLALNAAIEAGRLGAEGKQFVDAAEEIRVFVGNYNNTIEKMQEKIQTSNEKLEDMESKINHLINLLKENSISSNKIMKSAGGSEKKLKAISNDGFRGQISSTRNEIIKIKEIDEELLKTVERNKIQLEDMEAEFEVQLENEDEFLAGINPLFDEARNNAKEINKED